MKFHFIIILCILINTHSYPYFDKCTSIDESKKTLNTTDGLVRGECYSVPLSYSSNLKTSVDVYTWLSVPYATPVTPLTRFQKPKPFGKYTGLRNGTLWPKACKQKVQEEYPGVSWEDVKLENMSEDCLYLNIFARSDSYLNKESKLSPILFYIHGGTFVLGNSASDLLEPSTLVAMSGMIVVTFNYRLDTFGLLHINGTEASGNQAFLDQSMALKWVFDNAHTFGGDREKITIAGNSAGAISVGFHLFAPSSWPYFKNAILESGGPMVKGFELVTSEVATSISKAYLGRLGCNNTTSNEEIFKCAQNLDADKFTEETEEETGYYFVIDNLTFNKSIIELAKEKSFKKCNILTGFNSDEFVLYFTWPLFQILNKNDPSKWEEDAKNVDFNKFNSTINEINKNELLNNGFYSNLLKEYFSNQDLQNININPMAISFSTYLNRIGSDYYFICQSFNLAELYLSEGLDVYVYKYGYRISSTSFPETLASAIHVDELPIVFAEPLAIKKLPLLDRNVYSSTGHNYSKETKLFSENVVSFWSNFVKNGDPNTLVNGYFKTWIKFNGDNYLSFTNKEIKMMNEGISAHKCRFWNPISTLTTLISSATTTSPTPTALSTKITITSSSFLRNKSSSNFNHNQLIFMSILNFFNFII